MINIMTNQEIFDAIDQLQYVIDKHAKSGVYLFANQDDVKLLESAYNFITKRQYIKFNVGCNSCVKEAFLILNNWKKRELKKMEFEQAIADTYAGEKGDGKVVDMTEVEFTAEVAEQAIAEPIVEETKPIVKPKTNGRKRK